MLNQSEAILSLDILHPPDILSLRKKDAIYCNATN